MGRILAIDLGDRRTGLALSDPSRIFARPYKVLAQGEEIEMLDEIVRLIGEEEVDLILLGLPLNMDGSVGSRAQKVLAFKGRLEAVLEGRPEGTVPVETWDERLTTVQAESALRAAGVSGAERKKRVDKVAAQVLLQCYLDRPAE